MSDYTQTESYIVLKPIAERFSRIANAITDDEIKDMIKSSLLKQLSNIEFGHMVGYLVGDWVENNEEMICNYAHDAIKKKFQSL